MPLVGTLSTMPLPDLMQWLATASKTGTLQVERKKLTKWIQFDDGRLVGCSSDDPPQRLGQYLLSRELITEAQLRQGLEKQQETGQHLGITLVELGLLSPEELAKHLEAKAEETIYSLFDWSGGVFRFEEGLPPRNNIFPVSLSVQDVLLRGLKRYDEMRRIRDVFDSPSIILQYTDLPPSPEIFGNKMARAMYATIDGDRSIADILLHVHGSEYVVYKFLYDLHRNGFVELAGRKKVEAPVVPAPAVTADASTVRLSAPTRGGAAASPAGGGEDTPMLELIDPELGDDDGGADDEPEIPDSEVVTGMNEAQVLVADRQFEKAIDILDALYRVRPHHEGLKRMLADAEAAFVDRAYKHVLSPDKVPVLTKPADQLETSGLSPHDFFMLSRIDGTWDVKSIIQVAPLREVDALRTLQKMREKGMIELNDPE